MADFSSENQWYTSRLRKIHLLILFLLCVVNITLAITIAPEIVNIGGIDYPTGRGKQLMGAILTILITYNFVGFVLSNFASMVPYKNLTYAQKYVRISFNIMILIQLLVMIYGLLIHFNVITPLGY